MRSSVNTKSSLTQILSWNNFYLCLNFQRAHTYHLSLEVHKRCREVMRETFAVIARGPLNRRGSNIAKRTDGPSKKLIQLLRSSRVRKFREISLKSYYIRAILSGKLPASTIVSNDPLRYARFTPGTLLNNGKVEFLKFPSDKDVVWSTDRTTTKTAKPLIDCHRESRNCNFRRRSFAN